MRYRGASEVVLIILAVIALLAALGMGLMHMTMMGAADHSCCAVVELLDGRLRLFNARAPDWPRILKMLYPWPSFCPIISPISGGLPCEHRCADGMRALRTMPRDVGDRTPRYGEATCVPVYGA
jgi:hypothetical protein